MSVIANFKKRREQRKNNEQPSVEREATQTPAPENEALSLLAYLLGCDESQAIERAREAAEEKASFITSITEEAEQKKINAEVGVKLVKTLQDLQQEQAAAVNQTSDSVNHAADSVSHAADKVDQSASAIDDSASNIDDSASDLAYSADSIANAANDIKQATSELKKPSAAPKSSHSKKVAEPKKNLKK
jgi:hypothetical protein